MKFILVLIFSILISFQAMAMTMTQEQFDNMDVMLQACRTTFPGFEGFSGTRDNLIVYGTESEETISAFIQTVDIPSEKQKDPQRKSIKQLRAKFKALGFDNGDLKTMGYVTDID